MLTSRFEEAMTWAAQLHAQQVRKGSKVPYVSHLLSVAALVLEDGGSEDEAIGALLHDSIEDQGVRPEEIEKRFGPVVSRIVVECSDTDVTPKPPWLERKERYIEHLATATPEAVRVSLADKVHNARSIVLDLDRIGAKVWERFKASREETLWYYHAVMSAVEGRYSGCLLNELRYTIRRIEDVKQ